MRLNLDGAEVWRGLTFLGTVSADWLAAQIQDRLDNIEIAEWLRSELASDPTRHLGPPRDTSRPLAIAAPPYQPIAQAVKVARRARRQKNRGKRRPS
jgi:hypothetical protein